MVSVFSEVTLFAREYVGKLEPNPQWDKALQMKILRGLTGVATGAQNRGNRVAVGGHYTSDGAR